jgi:hypothetical protein
LIKKTIFIIFGIAFYCPKAIFPFFSWLPRFFGGAFFVMSKQSGDPDRSVGTIMQSGPLLPAMQSDSSLSRHTMSGLYGRFSDLTFFILSSL